MKLPWSKPPEERTITTTITETEAKVIASMRSYRGAGNWPTWKKIAVLILAGVLTTGGVYGWTESDPREPLFLLLGLIGFTVVPSRIWVLERRRKKWRLEEIHRMKGRDTDNENMGRGRAETKSMAQKDGRKADS